MISYIQKYKNISSSNLASLERRMLEYYSNVSTNYYSTSFEVYTNDRAPYHADLVKHVRENMEVLDFGCGSAHFAANIIPLGARYTGLEWSKEQIEANQRRFPQCTFASPDVPINRLFDIVVSLHVIEHVVHPEMHLQSLWDYTKPGGLIAVLCPDFVNCGFFPRSVFFGTTCARLSSKLKKGRILDSIDHVLDWKIRGPLWLRRSKREAPGAFWINLRPRVLEDGDGFMDADAVHLTRYEDIADWFEKRGAFPIRSSRMMTDVAKEISRFNMYILVKKPS